MRGPHAGFGPDPSGGSGMHRAHTHIHTYICFYIYRLLRLEDPINDNHNAKLDIITPTFTH